MRIAGIVAALTVACFAACTSSDSGSIKQWSGELPISAPWLRTQLPPGVVAYQRIPNLLGLLAIPKNNQFDTALRSEANIANVLSIQQGVTENLLSLQMFADPRLKFFADTVRSPIEIAAFGMPSPSVLIGVTLAVRSAADFERLFRELGRVQPSVTLAAPLDGQGFGDLVGLPTEAFVKFDAATGRLLIFSGTSSSRAAFTQLLQSMPASLKDHPMYALEQRIDTSGQGLFAWVDAAQVMPMADAFMPGGPGQLRALGLSGMKSAAFGFGTANGKGRMSLVFDVGTDHAARPLPLVANSIGATSVGEPDAAAVFSIPSSAEFARLESMVLGAMPPQGRSAWGQAKAKLMELTGVGLEEVFAALGPDVDGIFDEAGDYAAVRLRDPALFDDIVRRISAKTGAAPTEQTIGGATIHHWLLPANPGLGDGAAGAGGAADILTLLGRLHRHVYWIREGDYLYVSSVPQTLIDRAHAGAHASVADWLTKKQRIDVSTSLFAATANVAKMPRRSYEMYLGVMQTLADLTEAKFDIWSMPTADQLKLPDAGAIGFNASLGEPYVSFELSYENHPGELFFGGGGLASVAAVGVLAAIAIPAYQDYTVRAQVSEGLNLAAAAKAAVAQQILSRGSPPEDRRAAGMSPLPADSSGQYVAAIDVANGVITITYGNSANAQINGKALTLVPYASPDRQLVWVCGNAPPPAGARSLVAPGAPAGATVEGKYLPAACR
jgi:Tfp pilus assembly major pilin PilA